MPTVQVELTDSAYQQLEEFARLQGCSVQECAAAKLQQLAHQLSELSNIADNVFQKNDELLRRLAQ
jgi:hypothetical protein